MRRTESTADWTATDQIRADWLARLSRTLAEQSIDAAVLSDVLGDADTTWRSRLNGTRPLYLRHVLGIAAAFDVQLPDPLWRPNATRYDLANGATRIRFPTGRPGLPWIETALPVADVARDLAAWAVDEEDNGRTWTISSAVVLHELATLFQRAGAPSPVADPEDAHALMWPTHSTRLAVRWYPPFPASGVDQLRNIGQTLWAPMNVDSYILVIGADTALLRALDDIVRSGDQTLSFTEARQMNVAAEGLIDVQVANAVPRLDTARWRWFRIKH